MPVTEFDNSWNDFVERVRMAFERQFPRPFNEDGGQQQLYTYVTGLRCAYALRILLLPFHSLSNLSFLDWLQK